MIADEFKEALDRLVVGVDELSAVDAVDESELVLEIGLEINPVSCRLFAVAVSSADGKNETSSFDSIVSLEIEEDWVIGALDKLGVLE